MSGSQPYCVLLYEIIIGRLKFRKPWTRWVPKMLTDDHKANRVRSASEFLDRYEEESCIDYIVTKHESLTTDQRAKDNQYSGGIFVPLLQNNSWQRCFGTSKK